MRMSDLTIYDLLKEQEGAPESPTATSQKGDTTTTPTGKSKKGGGRNYKGHFIYGRPGVTKEVRGARARAVSEPKALLRDLKVNRQPRGATVVEKACDIITQARRNEVFGEAFTSSTFDRDYNICLITPAAEIMTSGPDKYIMATIEAAVNVGLLPDTLVYDYRAVGGDKKRVSVVDRDIVMTKKGLVLLRSLAEDDASSES